MSRRRTWTDEQLKEAVSTSFSCGGVLRKLGLVPAGGNYIHIQACMKLLGLDSSHFTGQAWNKGNTGGYKPHASLEEILVENSTYLHTTHLRRRLIREGILDEICNGCRIEEWMGQSMPLELDHINGRRSDNRRENLRLLCPNCHALTPNYRGKNIGRVVE